MMQKHKVKINVTNDGNSRNGILEGADMRLPRRLVRFLFGDFTTIYLLKPGQSVESVEIHPVDEIAGKEQA